MSNKLTISYDIGHSSIGWAILKTTSSAPPNILGCGSVIFPKDDCLASARRSHRRSRRNIRSTRLRIERIKKLILHLEVMTEAELNSTGHSAPHLLATKALHSESPTLTWTDIWHLIRWYAHNRGYDGNSRWSRQEDDGSDTEKEQAALELMKKHGTETMAETICAELELSIEDNKTSSVKPFKTLNAAFPRKVIISEITSILEKHKGQLPKLNQSFIDTLIASDEANGKRAWETIPVPEIKLPRRYFGGLLFGQLIPRFDNRIIAICPFSGEKVPNKSSKEFLLYRWAMIIANLKANGDFLTEEQRNALHDIMIDRGRLTGAELRKHVENLTGTTNTNCSSYFELHPDSAEALILDPALALFHGEGPGSLSLKPYWQHLPEISKYRAMGRWKKKRIVSLEWMINQCATEQSGINQLNEQIDKDFNTDQNKVKPKYPSYEHFLRRHFAPKGLSGRAPYSRKIMQQVTDYVLTTNLHPTAEHGPLHRSRDILKIQRDTNITEQTNNHLIRQRLQILTRLTKDIIEDYAGNKSKRVTDIVVEVARDLQEYSGMTAKEMAGELTKRLSHFKSAVKHLEKFAPDLPVTGSLIRKCRIAMDMDWKCPFTGKKYDVQSLPALEREHIIPYADRPSNSLDSLVLTFGWVNKLKAKRTGLQFINDMAGNDRFHTSKQYKAFVSKLKVAKRETYPDDSKRQSNRKKLMLIENFEAKDHGFTQGALTQTSHLNRLSARQLEKLFVDPITDEPTVRITSIPGQVTAETRKSWRLIGCLAQASPDILDVEGKTKTKTEIRKITHLHHALDAATLALTHHYLPGTFKGQNEKGAIWQALLKRNKTKEQINLLIRTGMFKTHLKTNPDGTPSKKTDVHLVDIDNQIKQQLSEKLSEQRIVQHIPADQSGASLELNQWRVWTIDGSPDDPKATVTIRQKTTEIKNGKRIYTHKETTEKAGKLVGLQDGKLMKNSAVLVIKDNFGIALMEEPEVIPFHDVPSRLEKLKQKNLGEKPQLLRNGMIIRISGIEGKEGLWRIFSSKAPAHLDIARLDVVSMESKGDRFWRQVSVKSLIKKNAITIMNSKLTGVSTE